MNQTDTELEKPVTELLNSQLLYTEEFLTSFRNCSRLVAMERRKDIIAKDARLHEECNQLINGFTDPLPSTIIVNDKVLSAADIREINPEKSRTFIPKPFFLKIAKGKTFHESISGAVKKLGVWPSGLRLGDIWYLKALQMTLVEFPSSNRIFFEDRQLILASGSVMKKDRTEKEYVTMLDPELKFRQRQFQDSVVPPGTSLLVLLA